jgi:hypothetical protein
LGIHGGEPLVNFDEGLFRAVDRRKLGCGGIGAEQRAGFAEVAVGVDVNRPDSLTGDPDRQGLARWLGLHAVQQAAVAEDDPGSDGRATGLQKITAGSHGRFPPFFLVRFQPAVLASK